MHVQWEVRGRRRKVLTGVFAATVACLLGMVGTDGLVTVAGAQTTSTFTPSATGELDCNGFSPVQKPVRLNLCSDIRGDLGYDNANTYGGRFYDNGHYIGHDEPDATFLSNQPGSGNDVTWTLTIGRDPYLAPTDANPGRDVSHWFELTPAPWFSMAMCDPNSYPQTACTPNSDSNAPTCFTTNCTTAQSGGGSAFMEMQLYPPGNPPFEDSESCDNAHWCAALTIDSLECTAGYAQCNTHCEEPYNFAFIQKNGAPTGPPGPLTADVASYTPNNETLLMDPGDTITVHMSDAPAPGGGDAFEVVIEDLTQHTTGYMQASAANGFESSYGIQGPGDCSGEPFNFQPEYSTAAQGNIIPWAALQTDISTEFETGHWEACTSLGEPFTSNPIDPADQSAGYNECFGPYESAGPPDSGTAETGDAMCYYAGSTHVGFDGPGTSSAPDELTGCQDNYFQNGDLDFDGTPYWPEWPTGPIPTIYPGSFVEQYPTTDGRAYSRYFFQTDIALSESTCGISASGAPTGCSVPPSGPGNFYPYWSELHIGNYCALEFGNVAYGRGVNSFGQDAEYGQDLFSQLGYPEFEGNTHNVDCRSQGRGGPQ